MAYIHGRGSVAVPNNTRRAEKVLTKAAKDAGITPDDIALARRVAGGQGDAAEGARSFLAKYDTSAVRADAETDAAVFNRAVWLAANSPDPSQRRWATDYLHARRLP